MPSPTNLLVIVLDGASDDPKSPETPLSAAETPGLDKLASHAVCGVHFPIGRGKAPESDTATLALLGYDPNKYYTGRGPLEALGAGIEIDEEHEVVFRANFATVDPHTKLIIDRRVARSLEDWEAEELAEAIDGMELGEHGYVRVKHTVGHRAVVVIGSRRYKLSPNVDNIDPAYRRVGSVSVAVREYNPYLPKCRPLDDATESRITCNLVDEFTKRVLEVLSNHPINMERKRKGLLQANAILLRDAGSTKPRLPPISSITGLSPVAAIVEMPVEVGIARAAGMKIYPVPPPRGDMPRELPVRLRAVLDALRDRNSLVYVHLKGPDEPGHDGDCKAKKKSIELIDKYFVQPLLEKIDLEETAVLVTSDHATPCNVRAHTGDPVPWMLSWRGFGERIVFSESYCYEKGTVIEHGWDLLRHVTTLLKQQ